MLGDEGSGFWIGLEAIRSSLRALDRGVPTCVLREIGAFWHVSGIGALLAKANSQPRPDFAALATVVAQCAAKGDPLAKSVLERAGQELAAQVGIVVSKMRAAGCSTADANVVGFTGTVLSHFLTVRETMQASLRLSHPRISLQDRATQPIEGALARARHG
jgi:N-acetylglucosamine kinase-like BadF-type ATPase